MMKYTKSIFNLVLTSLILTANSSAATSSTWSWPQCKTQCTQSSCAKESRLMDCAMKCDLSSVKNCVDKNIKQCKDFKNKDGLTRFFDSKVAALTAENNQLPNKIKEAEQKSRQIK
jgi:hypothetical protein